MTQAKPKGHGTENQEGHVEFVQWNMHDGLVQLCALNAKRATDARPNSSFLSERAPANLQIRPADRVSAIDEPITYRACPADLDGFEISDHLIPPSERPQNFAQQPQ